MELVIPTPEQGVFGLRAMKTIALADGELSALELAMLAAGRDFTRATCDLEALESITPEELAAAIADPALRQQLVNTLVVMSLVDEEADKREIACIQAFSRALDVSVDAVTTARRLARGQLRLARFDILRRQWAVDKIRERVAERGFGELWRTIQALRRRYVNEELAARYRALGELPEGTLGRVYHDSMRSFGLPLPGEPCAAPEVITYHDMAHVLGGYGVTPPEEVLIACFSAGFRQRNPMTFVLFVMCQFHLGLATAPGIPPERGHFDPRTALAAIRRGAAMTVDLSDGWEYWDVIDQPVEALRERYHIAPREP